MSSITSMKIFGAVATTAPAPGGTASIFTASSTFIPSKWVNTTSIVTVVKTTFTTVVVSEPTSSSNNTNKPTSDNTQNATSGDGIRDVLLGYLLHIGVVIVVYGVVHLTYLGVNYLRRRGKMTGNNHGPVQGGVVVPIHIDIPMDDLNVA